MCQSHMILRKVEMNLIQNHYIKTESITIMIEGHIDDLH